MPRQRRETRQCSLRPQAPKRARSGSHFSRSLVSGTPYCRCCASIAVRIAVPTTIPGQIAFRHGDGVAAGADFVSAGHPRLPRGIIRLLFATPLVAAGLVLVRMIYVEDILGERKSEPAPFKAR